MEFRVLDLFCGAGGFSAGLDQVKNFSTQVGLDFDKYAIETFSKNFPKNIFDGNKKRRESIKTRTSVTPVPSAEKTIYI